MKLDNYEFEKVAAVLVRINKSIVDNQNIKNKEDMISFMESMAYQYMHEGTVFSTGGFMLTAFVDSSGERVVRASLTAYCVEVYMKAVEERVQKLLDPV